MAPAFLTRARTAANRLWTNAPTYLSQARNFVTQAVKHAGTGHKMITHVNRAVQESPLFNQKFREGSGKVASHADTHLRRLQELHRHGDDFLARVTGPVG